MNKIFVCLQKSFENNEKNNKKFKEVLCTY